MYAGICVFVILSLALVFCPSLSFFCLHTDILTVSSDVLFSLFSLDLRWPLVLLRSGSTVKSTFNYGFTSILADGIEKPQCVLFFKVLGNDSMRPSKLKHH